MSNEIPNAAYRWAAAFFLLFGLYAYYMFHSAGIFLAQHYLPENAAGFSLANPNFPVWNNLIAIALGLIVTLGMYANEKLRDYMVDVGDELSRVTWAELKETQKATVVVVALCTTSAIFLFVADQVFLKIVNFFMSFAA